MDLAELQTFLTVASERSFSRAAVRLHRTQPAVSQAVRRLEEDLNERLFDRTSKGGRLTEAGRILLDYARRLTDLRDEAASAVRELQDFRRGRVAIGANEAAVHVLLPIVSRFRDEHPEAQIDVRRVPARQVATEVINGTLDFGVLTFHPSERGLSTVTVGADELVLLTSPDHPLAGQDEISMEEFGRQTVIAHNDPSPARDRVLRLSQQRHAPINIQMSFPSLDGIKRAVEMGLGVALLPRRCALAEIARGQLAVVRVSQLRLPRQIRLVYRRAGEKTRAVAAFLDVAKDAGKKDGRRKPRSR
ncbi:MAG: LysR family transcriptional regulator [Vicinamibacterales bacterium]|nr:LysR family transcriptional regulator [Acidobacteriota bacterium]MDP6371303.1 LysR family transcriptional regulator [Vicinamibacterales bacterium]MDP6610539.1 LysR family transcriptional regulator [Vicinamibacterales bacterium]HAK55062.1 LysR family transcriptional regulator [Acidobacteriota bacterium]